MSLRERFRLEEPSLEDDGESVSMILLPYVYPDDSIILDSRGSISSTLSILNITDFLAPPKQSYWCPRKAQLLAELTLDVAAIVVVEALGIVNEQGYRWRLTGYLGAVVNFALPTLASDGRCVPTNRFF
jgi:hypothetical protein